jgi:biopolymer transport protein ExbD
MAGGADVGGRRRGGIISSINITPLCDILLVLLIIFMVASTYIVSQALKVQLPKAKTSDGTSEGPATLTLLRNGDVRWNGESVPEAAVERSLRDAVAVDPGLELIISADREVMHGRVVQFIDLAKQAGILKFAINVERTE